jgi:molybdenum cofactor biosynthesis enzyme MoaA
VVCRDEAQQVTREVGMRRGVAIGRTSHRVRNPANAQPVTVDLGGRIGMLRPIGTQPFCETCHGARETVDAAIGDVLKTAYPDDEAVGFAAGDLRGWFWVEADVAR